MPASCAPKIANAPTCHHTASRQRPRLAHGAQQTASDQSYLRVLTPPHPFKGLFGSRIASSRADQDSPGQRFLCWHPAGQYTANARGGQGIFGRTSLGLGFEDQRTTQTPTYPRSFFPLGPVSDLEELNASNAPTCPRTSYQLCLRQAQPYSDVAGDPAYFGMLCQFCHAQGPPDGRIAAARTLLRSLDRFHL